MNTMRRLCIIALAATVGSIALVGCESDSSGSKDKAESVEAKKKNDQSKKSDKSDKTGSAAKSDDKNKKAENPLAGAPEKATVGKKAPDFTLTDTQGNKHSLSDYVGDKMVVLEWTSPECPYVKRHYKSKTMQKTLKKLGGSKKVAWFAINSNKGEAQVTKKWKKEHGLSYPILIDESGEVGKSYGAKTTPHMYIIDKEGVLRYNGAIDSDDSAKGKMDDPTNYVLQAGKALKNGESIEKKKTDPYGCSVKYGS